MASVNLSKLEGMLAKKLFTVALNDPLEKVLGHPMCPRAYMAMANECLRQMEWARRYCITEYTLVEHSASGAIRITKIDQPLTVAPDEWRP